MIHTCNCLYFFQGRFKYPHKNVLRIRNSHGMSSLLDGAMLIFDWETTNNRVRAMKIQRGNMNCKESIKIQ